MWQVLAGPLWVAGRPSWVALGFFLPRASGPGVEGLRTSELTCSGDCGDKAPRVSGRCCGGSWVTVAMLLIWGHGCRKGL